MRSNSSTRSGGTRFLHFDTAQGVNLVPGSNVDICLDTAVGPPSKENTRSIGDKVFMGRQYATDSSVSQLPTIAHTTTGSDSILRAMGSSSKSSFAERLREQLILAGHRAKRSAKSGVDVSWLAKQAEITREMARRYVLGIALPEPDKINKIATALGVRVAYLRDGEGGPVLPVAPTDSVRQNSANYDFKLSESAIEIARVWMALPVDRQQCYREMMFLEAAVTKFIPWLRMQSPTGEHYKEFERRVEQDFAKFAEQLKLKF